MWVTLEKLLAATKSRVDSVLNEVRMEDPTIKDRLRQAAWERIGKDHPVCCFPMLLISFYIVLLYKVKFITSSKGTRVLSHFAG